MTTSGRKTAIAVTVMVVVVLVALFELSRLGGEDPGRRADRPNVPAASPLHAPSKTRDAPRGTTSPTKGASASYVVARGDTLTSIARHFEVPTSAIAAANQLTDPDQLAVGQRIVIPPPLPVELTLTPTSTSGGRPIEVRLTGAKPGENVSFTVITPSGTFTGPPHEASEDGTVVSTYTPNFGAPAGIGTVSAVGDRGTTATATFGLVS